MGWATQRGPRQCKFVDLERGRFQQNRHIIFQAHVALKLLVSLISSLVAFSSRINSNPRCACAPRVCVRRIIMIIAQPRIILYRYILMRACRTMSRLTPLNAFIIVFFASRHPRISARVVYIIMRRLRTRIIRRTANYLPRSGDDQTTFRGLVMKTYAPTLEPLRYTTG